jgi:hypothetical protein
MLETILGQAQGERRIDSSAKRWGAPAIKALHHEIALAHSPKIYLVWPFLLAQSCFSFKNIYALHKKDVPRRGHFTLTTGFEFCLL